MKLYASKQIKLFNIDVQFVDIGTTISSAVVPHTAKTIGDISKVDLQEFYSFLDDVDVLICDLEHRHILQRTSLDLKDSKGSKLSSYWKFYFVINDTSIIDKEYLIDLGVSHHFRSTKDSNKDFKEYNQQIVDNPNQKCKFERIIINNIAFQTYGDAIVYIENKILHLYKTYKEKYSNDDYIQENFPSVYFDELYNFLEDTVIFSKLTDKDKDKQDILIDNKNIQYENLMEDTLNTLLKSVRNCSKAERERYHNFKAIKYVKDYIRKQTDILQPVFDFITNFQ